MLQFIFSTLLGSLFIFSGTLKILNLIFDNSLLNRRTYEI